MKLLSFAGVLICLFATLASAQFTPPVPPAFPGAQGGGANSLGGRGGTVVLVTNTSESGAGSLRSCIERSGPRTCVFCTGGTIALTNNPLWITEPYITITGQTAPGDGIQITGPSNSPGNAALQIWTHDVVIRYIRVRRGHWCPNNRCESCTANCGANLLLLSNGPTTDPSSIMLDHISIEWSNYEAIIALGQNNVPYEPRLATVSWSIIGEALAGAGQTTAAEYGGVSLAGSYAPDLMTDLDLHHNLFAGASHRMPLLTVKSGRLVNNIVYAWTYYPMRNKGFRDFVANLFLLRTGQLTPSHEIQAWTENAQNDTSFPPAFYVSGNIGPHDANGTNNWNLTAHTATESGSEDGPLDSGMYQRQTPIPTPTSYVPISADAASTLPSILLNTARTAPYDGVGASRSLDCQSRWLNQRDSVDQRIAIAVANGTVLYTGFDYSDLAHSPSDQNSLGGFPGPDAGTPCVDANNNGMPDVWEAYWAAHFGHGTTLDPNAMDWHDGYTDLEHYMNGTDPSP